MSKERRGLLSRRRSFLAGAAAGIAACVVSLWLYDRGNYKGWRGFEAATGDYVVKQRSLFGERVLERRPSLLLPKYTHRDVVMSTFENKSGLLTSTYARGSSNSTLHSLSTKGVGDLAAGWSEAFHRRVSDTLWEASDRHDGDAVNRIFWTAFESPGDVAAVVDEVRARWSAADEDGGE